jgi:hypothetical protein
MSGKMVKFTDEIYIRNHGIKPRGKGFWAFRFDNDEETHWFPSDDNAFAIAYSKAKKQAIAKAKELGVQKVYLLS